MIKITAILLFLLGIASSPLFSQIPLSFNRIAKEDFNSLGTAAEASLPDGWRLSPGGNITGGWAAGLSTTTQAAHSGIPAIPGRYN